MMSHFITLIEAKRTEREGQQEYKFYGCLTVAYGCLTVACRQIRSILSLCRCSSIIYCPNMPISKYSDPLHRK